VAAINVHFDAATKERYDAVSRRDRYEIALLEVLRYGLRSCHWSSLSFGGQGLSSATNRRQARFLLLYFTSFLAVPVFTNVRPMILSLFAISKRSAKALLTPGIA
jgi:hypothetical protein